MGDAIGCGLSDLRQPDCVFSKIQQLQLFHQIRCFQAYCTIFHVVGTLMRSDCFFEMYIADRCIVLRTHYCTGISRIVQKCLIWRHKTHQKHTSSILHLFSQYLKFQFPFRSPTMAWKVPRLITKNSWSFQPETAMNLQGDCIIYNTPLVRFNIHIDIYHIYLQKK